MENQGRRCRMFSDCFLFAGIFAVTYALCISAAKMEQPLTSNNYRRQNVGIDNNPIPTTTPPPTTTPKPLPPRPSKPHVVLILADDLGWNDVSWNNPGVMTPNMDSLARGGVILNQSYVLPTCTPTRVALLSGRYPFTMGMQQGALFPSEPAGLPLRYKLLPRKLKKEGYSTHCIGKWHLGFCHWNYTPTRRGFDTFYGFYTGSLDYVTHKRSEKNVMSWQYKKERASKKQYLDLRNNTKPDDTKGGIYSTHLFATAAEEIIRSRDPNEPMFLYLPFQSVHAPLQVPKNYSTVYSHVKTFYRRKYLGMVLAMDEAIGRVVQAMKDTGHYDNSVIIFTTDNGGSIKIGSSNWPLCGGKSNLLEGGTRGPAFIHSPYLFNPGTVSNEIIHVTDWYSTIVGLAGSTAPRFNDGIDQWYAINGLQPTPRENFIYNIEKKDKRFRAAIRLKDLKLSVGVLKRQWVPIYPIQLRAGREKNILLPESYVNGTEKEVDLDLHFSDVSNRSIIHEKNAITVKTESCVSFSGENNTTEKKMVESSNVSHLSPSDSFPSGKSHRKNINKNESYSMKKKDRRIKNPEEPENKIPCLRNENKGIKWRRLRKHKDITWNPQVLRKLNRFIPGKTLINLYNITDDPTESNDIVDTELSTVQSLMNSLAAELYRYVPINLKKKSGKAHPKFWNNVWSPGWCKAKY